LAAAFDELIWRHPTCRSADRLGPLALRGRVPFEALPAYRKSQSGRRSKGLEGGLRLESAISLRSASRSSFCTPAWLLNKESRRTKERQKKLREGEAVRREEGGREKKKKKVDSTMSGCSRGVLPVGRSSRRRRGSHSVKYWELVITRVYSAQKSETKRGGTIYSWVTMQGAKEEKKKGRGGRGASQEPPARFHERVVAKIPRRSRSALRPGARSILTVTLRHPLGRRDAVSAGQTGASWSRSCGENAERAAERIAARASSATDPCVGPCHRGFGGGHAPFVKVQGRWHGSGSFLRESRLAPARPVRAVRRRRCHIATLGPSSVPCAPGGAPTLLTVAFAHRSPGHRAVVTRQPSAL